MQSLSTARSHPNPTTSSTTTTPPHKRILDTACVEGRILVVVMGCPSLGHHSQPVPFLLGLRWEERERDGTDFQVDPIQQVLHGLGLWGSPFPPPPGWAFGLLFLLVEHIHIDELERAHLVVQQAHPGAHGRLADDIDDVSFLWRNKELR